MLLFVTFGLSFLAFYIKIHAIIKRENLKYGLVVKEQVLESDQPRFKALLLCGVLIKLHNGSLCLFLYIQSEGNSSSTSLRSELRIEGASVRQGYSMVC